MLLGKWNYLGVGEEEDQPMDPFSDVWFQHTDRKSNEWKLTPSLDKFSCMVHNIHSWTTLPTRE